MYWFKFRLLLFMTKAWCGDYTGTGEVITYASADRIECCREIYAALALMSSVIIFKINLILT